jgi:hypothetical protein
MGRKDVMHRTEGAVADLPAVKVRGIAVGGIAAGGVALRALATGAVAAGAAAIGAFAIGALAVGRLRVGNAAAKKLSVGRLEVDELVIGGKPVRVEDLGPVIGSAWSLPQAAGTARLLLVDHLRDRNTASGHCCLTGQCRKSTGYRASESGTLSDTRLLLF